MSWIKDVKNEIKELDVSEKSLKKFGLMIGGVFLILSLLFFYKGWLANLRLIFAAAGLYLFISGMILPASLKLVYKIWMGFAFALGWLVSRFIIVILFIFVLTPVGLLAKFFGKKFLDVVFRDGKESYWIPKENKNIDYEKMY